MRSKSYALSRFYLYLPQVYQDFTAKVTGLEERRKLIKDAKATEVRGRSKFLSTPFFR